MPRPTDELPEPHHPQNRATAESKLRRGGKHCPVCLEPLGKNAGRTRLLRFCQGCQAHPSQGKRCARCGVEAVWEGPTGAGCAACGHHGRKADVAKLQPDTT